MPTTHLTSTLRAPSGVTIVAGAKAYAAKFMHSPEATESRRPDTQVVNTIHCWNGTNQVSIHTKRSAMTTLWRDETHVTTYHAKWMLEAGNNKTDETHGMIGMDGVTG